MLPVSLIFTSGVVSGVNSYAAVLVLGLIGKFGHVSSIPPVLEKPSVLAAAAVLYIGQFVVGKVPVLDSAWDLVHTALRPVVGAAIGVVVAQHTDAGTAATIAAAALGGGTALTSHAVKTGVRLGVNASPEPFSNIIASLLEDLGVVSLAWWAVYHPLAAAMVTECRRPARRAHAGRCPGDPSTSALTRRRRHRRRCGWRRRRTGDRQGDGGRGGGRRR